MSLRFRLFFLVAGLLALLMGAQWWLVRSLARDLELEVSAVVLSMGRSLVDLFEPGAAPPASGEDPGKERQEVEVRVIRQKELRTEAAIDCADAKSPECQEPRGDFLIVEERVLRPEGNGHPPDAILSGNSEPAGPQGADSPATVRRMVRVMRHGETVEEVEKEIAQGWKEMAGDVIQEDLHGLQLPADTLVTVDHSLSGGPPLVRRIPLPLSNFDERLRHFSQRLLLGSALLLALGLVSAAVLAHRITRPLRSLAGAARRLGEGDLGVQVPEAAGGEVGEALEAFNRMSLRLAELEESAQQLRTAQQLGELGEVSRGLAHSLRNPLHALGLSLETLAEGDLDPDRRQALAQTARQQIRRVDTSLRSFLALASSGGEPEPVDVAALLQDVALEAVQALPETAADERPALEVRPAPCLPPLRAVAPELRAVLQALVVNAVEASPPGGRVALTAEVQDDGRLCITVTDQGTGLPPEVRSRLFTPHTSTKPLGSGMGLFLAHRIATSRYGGDLSLVDREPHGTRAVLILGPRQGEEAGGGPHG
jgi:signal transduction histidine kinase